MSLEQVLALSQRAPGADVQIISVHQLPGGSVTTVYRLTLADELQVILWLFNLLVLRETAEPRIAGLLIQRAYSKGEHLVVEKNDLPVVVILSVKDYEELRWKAALHNLQELNQSLNKQAKAQGLTPEMLEGKIAETKREIFDELYG